MPRDTLCNLDRISDRNFPKFSRPQNFAFDNRARSRRNACRLVVRSLLTTFRGPQHLLRASACCGACDFVRFGADFGPKFSKIFAAAKFFVRNRARSRRNPYRLVLHSFLTTPRGPQHLLRGSACCNAYDLVRFGADFGPKFSKIKIFRGRKIFRSKSCKIAPIYQPPGVAQLPHDP